MIRYQPNPKIGLSKEQVEKRKQEDLWNKDTSVPTKSIKRILYDNFFTLFISERSNPSLSIKNFCKEDFKILTLPNFKAGKNPFSIN